MVAPSLSAVHMAPATRKLFRYECDLAKSEQSSRVINIITFFGVSLLAHAQAVNLLAKWLFTTIFEANNSEKIRMQRDECLAAYAVCWLSLWACVNQTALHYHPVQELEPAPQPDRQDTAFSEPAPSTCPLQSMSMQSDGTSSLMYPAMSSVRHSAEAAGPAFRRMQRHERESRIDNDLEIVDEKLKRELRSANARQHIVAKGVILQPAGACQFVTNDPRFTLSSQTAGLVHVGMCHFSERTIAKGELLALHFDLRIGNQRYPVHVFGIFDAWEGPHAAQFIKMNLEKILTQLLKTCNLSMLSPIGVRNALKLLFVELDQQFEANCHDLTDAGRSVTRDGATAVVTMLLEGRCWTASLGRGLAVAFHEEEATRLDREAHPEDEAFQRGVVKRGGFIQDGLVSGLVPTTRAVGLHHVGDAISRRSKVTDMPLSNGYLVLGSAKLSSCCGVEDLSEILSGEARKNDALARGLRDHPESLAAGLVVSALHSLPVDKRACDLSCVVVRIDQEEMLEGTVMVHRDPVPASAAPASEETQPLADVATGPAVNSAPAADTEDRWWFAFNRWWQPNNKDPHQDAAAEERGEGAAAAAAEGRTGEPAAVAERREIPHLSAPSDAGSADLVVSAEAVFSVSAASTTPGSDQPGSRERASSHDGSKRARQAVEAQILERSESAAAAAAGRSPEHDWVDANASESDEDWETAKQDTQTELRR